MTSYNAKVNFDFFEEFSDNIDEFESLDGSCESPSKPHHVQDSISNDGSAFANKGNVKSQDKDRLVDELMVLSTRKRCFTDDHKIDLLDSEEMNLQSTPRFAQSSKKVAKQDSLSQTPTIECIRPGKSMSRDIKSMLSQLAMKRKQSEVSKYSAMSDQGLMIGRQSEARIKSAELELIDR